MTSLRRRVKNLLEHRKIPNFLYSIYFQQQLKKGQDRLSAVLNSKADLMDHLNPEAQKYWLDRINDVLWCEDNKDIKKHQAAGTMDGDALVMHNGIKVNPLGYYSFPVLKMLMQNKGVHEPQEEKIFQEVVNSLQPSQSPVMLELGSYWAFYSMWFKQVFPDAICYMVEPERKNLFFGKENFKLNKMEGTFIHAGIGKQQHAKENITTVDAICQLHDISFLDILHSDIQGFELDMIEGSQRMLSNKKVGYVFISTHSNDLHRDCEQVLKDKYGFQTVASADLDNTFSWDGVLVMKAPDYPGLERVEISKKTHVNN